MVAIIHQLSTMQDWMHSTWKRCCGRQLLFSRLPFLGWMSRYTWHMLPLDVIAGITVGFTIIPQVTNQIQYARTNFI